MHLIVSDMHFGRDDAQAEREKERALVACLRAHAADLGGLVLLGDVFEYWIEYEHVMPKGYSRFLGCLAELADAGVALTVFAGNHDPWHRDYFATEFGARFFSDSHTERMAGLNCTMAHGDGVASYGRVYRRIKPILRHPLPVTVYKKLLPADIGVGLARWVSARFSAHELNRETVASVREYAQELLSTSDADVVILGHSHYPELSIYPFGTYLNTGSWHYDRSFGIVDDAGVHLHQWQDGAAHPFERPFRELIKTP